MRDKRVVFHALVLLERLRASLRFDLPPLKELRRHDPWIQIGVLGCLGHGPGPDEAVRHLRRALQMHAEQQEQELPSVDLPIVRRRDLQLRLAYRLTLVHPLLVDARAWSEVADALYLLVEEVRSLNVGEWPRDLDVFFAAHKAMCLALREIRPTKAKALLRRAIRPLPVDAKLQERLGDDDPMTEARRNFWQRVLDVCELMAFKSKRLPEALELNLRRDQELCKTPSLFTMCRRLGYQRELGLLTKETLAETTDVFVKSLEDESDMHQDLGVTLIAHLLVPGIEKPGVLTSLRMGWNVLLKRLDRGLKDSDVASTLSQMTIAVLTKVHHVCDKVETREISVATVTTAIEVVTRLLVRDEGDDDDQSHTSLSLRAALKVLGKWLKRFVEDRRVRCLMNAA